MSHCEWDPERGQPAAVVTVPLPLTEPGRRERQGCPNRATLSVGGNGRWHLCDACAALPEFKSLRRRVPLAASQSR